MSVYVVFLCVSILCCTLLCNVFQKGRAHTPEREFWDFKAQGFETGIPPEGKMWVESDSYAYKNTHMHPEKGNLCGK